MSEHQIQNRICYLFVSKPDEAEAALCAQRLTHGGAAVEFISDVYAATAKLASGTQVRRVLVDIRGLDRVEMAFLLLAPRYFPEIDFVVPMLPGTIERAAAFGESLPIVSVESLTGALTGVTDDRMAGVQREFGVLPIEVDDVPKSAMAESPNESYLLKDIAGSEEAPPAEPAVEAIEEVEWGEPIDEPTESPEDIRPDEPSPEPSLHEAVRMRMAGHDARTVRRRPPRADGDAGDSQNPGPRSAEAPVNPMEAPIATDAPYLVEPAFPEDDRGGTR